MDENMRIDIAEDSKEKQAEGRISARWLGRSEIISRGTIKIRRTRRTTGKKMESEEKEKKSGRETSGKNGEMARKEMKMKRARWPVRYKKDDERKGLIPRKVI